MENVTIVSGFNMENPITHLVDIIITENKLPDYRGMGRIYLLRISESFAMRRKLEKDTSLNFEDCCIYPIGGSIGAICCKIEDKDEYCLMLRGAKQSGDKYSYLYEYYIIPGELYNKCAEIGKNYE